jgi:hypothetical protein
MSLAAQLDRTLRLLVVESALGLPQGRLSNQCRNLDPAIAAENPALRAEWLTAQNTGLYGKLLRDLGASVARENLGHAFEASDFLQEALTRTSSNPFVYFGQMQRARILKGALGVGAASQGYYLRHWLLGKVTSAAGKRDRRLGILSNTFVPAPCPDKFHSLLEDPQFRELLSLKVTQVWEQLPETFHPIMKVWTFDLGEGSVASSSAELAIRAGILDPSATPKQYQAARVKSRKHLTRVLPLIVEALLADSEIQKYSARLLAQGIDLHDLTLTGMRADDRYGRFYYGSG